jgi:hypothetical protein
MSIPGSYRKAYPISQFRKAQDWTEPEGRDYADGEVLFLHEDYTVTDDIPDEGVIFNDRSAEWEAFCKRMLGFKLPPSDAF